MMHTDQAFRNPEHGPAIVRALRSLAFGDADLIAQAVGTIGHSWSVQSFDDYEGYLSVLVEPEDASQPSYLISGTLDQIELARLSYDNLRTLGCFQNVATTADQLIQLLQG